jgi:hypothetical protein
VYFIRQGFYQLIVELLVKKDFKARNGSHRFYDSDDHLLRAILTVNADFAQGFSVLKHGSEDLLTTDAIRIGKV